MVKPSKCFSLFAGLSIVVHCACSFFGLRGSTKRCFLFWLRIEALPHKLLFFLSSWVNYLISKDMMCLIDDWNDTGPGKCSIVGTGARKKPSRQVFGRSFFVESGLCLSPMWLLVDVVFWIRLPNMNQLWRGSWWKYGKSLGILYFWSSSGMRRCAGWLCMMAILRVDAVLIVRIRSERRP